MELRDRQLLQAVDENRFIGAMVDGLREYGELPGLPVQLFDSLWKVSDAHPGARLQLLALAAATGSEAAVAAVSQQEQLSLIDRSPGEVCDRLRSSLRDTIRGEAGAVLLGLLDVVRLVRTKSLEAAIERYWSIDQRLVIDANAALNRLLVYQLADAGRVQAAHEFLQRWRLRHGAAVRGTPLEIQIAAREVNLLGTHGSLAEAEALADRFQDEFAGRAGAWVLHMVATNLAEERGMLGQALSQAEAALAGLRSEDGPPEMELDILAYLCTAIVGASDRSRWAALDGHLQRAESLAIELDVPSITHRVQTATACRLLYRGDLDRAQQHLLRIRRSAERSGELQRAQFIDTSLFIASREAGDFQGMLSRAFEYRRLTAEKESAREILSVQEELCLLSLALGDLEDVKRSLDTALPAAQESALVFFTGIFTGIKGRLALLGGDSAAATRDLRHSVSEFSTAYALRYRNEYQLELIAVDPTADPDGSLIAAVIDHEQAVGERRLLPRAWQLEARRLRLAGAIREAALALAEAFRVAETLVSPEHRWPLHLEAAELALAAGERDAARADLERAVAILHDFSLQFPDPAVRERFLARPDRRAVLERLRTLNA